ncbi:MAG: protein translocase subunit SecD [Candidatus Rokuibacteriota bacterium]|nr:MAG: protein translocase subunit SecD [Candidatus Rokubacteria bacterium]
MPRHLRVRIAFVLLVVAVSVWYLYPLKRALNLGLDLQGGIHLMLGVEADKHVASQTDRTAEDLKRALERKGIGVQRIAREGNSTIQVELASPQSWNDALTAVAEFSTFTRRDENQAAGRFKLVMVERQINQLRDDAVRQGLETIRNRVDQFGVAEPTITRQGADQILIQLPGIQDPARAKALIGKTALLEFKMLDEQTSVEQALAGQLPETSELLYGRETDKQTKAERKVPYVVQRRTLLTGAELTRAEVQADPNSLGNWQVAIEFTSAGTRIFGELTEQNVGKRLAIVLDGNVYSAPRINERIPSGRAVITGHFTVDDARDLAIVLRAGALPAPVVLLEERTVGPSLGADSIRQGLIAITASAVIVFIFMLVYYRLSGLIADVALGLNLLMLFAFMAAIRATLTLPGLAGIALTVGMAVDTNILIFERIREELRLGKSPRSAVEAGFRRAFRTIVDTHLTVMGTAIILLSFGTSSVKGFGVSLFIGLGASLFTAYFFTRLLFDLVYMGRRKLEQVSI